MTNARTVAPALDVTLLNPQADRVKQVRALSGRSARERQGLFLAEGPQCVREAVTYAAGDIRALYMSPAAYDRHRDIVDLCRQRQLPIHGASPQVILAMSPDSQGLVATVRIRPAQISDIWPDASSDTSQDSQASAKRHASIASSDSSLASDAGHVSASNTPQAAVPPRLLAILHQVRDPGNAGTVIRTADAAGASAVILAGDCVDMYNPKTVRSTVGSLFHLPVISGLSLPDAVTLCRAAGMTILAADGSGHWDIDSIGRQASGHSLAAPTAWIFGNEAWGLSEADRLLADAVVKVPLRGKAESLNLATAAAVCLYASSSALFATT